MTTMLNDREGGRESLADIEETFDRLWPIMRSITGDGVRETHDILSDIVPLERIEVPFGTQVLDWTVPKEWRFNEAYVVAPDGRRILDAKDNTLRLVNYSAPFRGKLTREALDEHLHSRPDLPDAIPYVTSYYEERWGFCLSQRERDSLLPGEYHVVVDTAFHDGSLTISEAVLSGTESDEVLISTNTCHPSMANNELSGPLAAAYLYRRIAAWPQRRLTYRFAFGPETIGAITYLSMRGEHWPKSLVAGFVVTCVGLDQAFVYKRSRRGDSLADRAAIHALEHMAVEYTARDFKPVGSDERQYCSPGYDLPVGSLMRGPHGDYPEYHTSLDNKSLISFDALRGSVDAYEAICRTLDRNLVFRNRYPFGEPQLGRRGLYPTLGTADQRSKVETLLWVLNLSDGHHDLLSIAERSGLPLDSLWDAARAAEEQSVLERVTERTDHSK
jgi:aminopeptidase-like protein